MAITYCCVYSVETPDDGQQICPKNVAFFIKINLRKVHPVGFYYNNESL
jgi:hypothetical protein